MVPVELIDITTQIACLTNSFRPPISLGSTFKSIVHIDTAYPVDIGDFWGKLPMADIVSHVAPVLRVF